MAVIQITSCSGAPTYNVEYGGGPITFGDVFYFTFTGSTPSGCYTYDGLGVLPIDDEVLSKVLYGGCIECEASITPTPTPTNTETPNNSPTPTPTETPTQTPTNTETPTGTPSETPTGTPSETPTQTPTNTETPTPTPTVTNTQTPTQTPCLDTNWITWTGASGGTFSLIGGGTIALTSVSTGTTLTQSVFGYARLVCPDKNPSGIVQGIQNEGFYTYTFSQPVTNPLLAVYSLGRDTPSPITASLSADTAFTVYCSGTSSPSYAISYDLINQSFSGTEGYGIVQFVGTVTHN